MMVRLDRALACRTLIFAAFLLWPLILFGRPTYLMGDSLAYLKTGQQAVEFAESKISSRVPGPAPTSAVDSVGHPDPAPAARGADTKTARSVTYSVAAYALRWPGQDLTALAAVQVLAVSILCAIIGSVLGLGRLRSYAAVAPLAAFATPLSAFAAFTVPDIWAGDLLGAMTLLIATGDRLSFGVKTYLALVIMFAISAHASIPPIAAGMTIIGVVCFVFQRRTGLKIPARKLSWLLLPVLFGFGANIAINYVSFGKVSATGKRIPTALARSIAQGPGKWYLEEQCKTPRYAVCEIYGTKIPGTINGFLFDKNSLNDLATPEQMDRIRAQESEIVLRAAMTYPGVEARKLATGILKQLVTFDLGLTNFKRQVEMGTDGLPTLAESGRDHSALLHTIDILVIMLLVLSAGWVFLRYRQLHAEERVMLMLLVIGMLGNALVCSAFSGVAERYQARIVWLFPVFILFMIASRFAAETRASAENRA